MRRETSLDDENLTPPQGFDPQASQAVGSHYNDHTIPAPFKIVVEYTTVTLSLNVFTHQNNTHIYH